MKQSLDILCKNFIENRDIIKETFKWESSYMLPVCASIFTDKEICAEKEKLVKCNQILKENTGFFSNFKGHSKLATVSILATSNNPEEKLKKTLEIYNVLRKDFNSSEYLVLGAIILADLVGEQNYFDISAKAKEIYKIMKSHHPFLTSSEDSVLCIFLSLSNKTNEEISVETEKCYALIKQHFFSSNAVQSLSHALTLCDGSAEIKTGKVMEFYNTLKDKGYKYGTGYELASLGVLAMLPVHMDVIINDLIHVDKFLSGQKGYGLLGFSKSQRLMHSAMIVVTHHLEKNDTNILTSAVTSATISLIIAQQTAVIAAVVASSAASSASN